MKLILEPGTEVRWYRQLGHGRTQILAATVMRKISDQSIVIVTKDGWQHAVRAHSLMPAQEGTDRV